MECEHCGAQDDITADIAVREHEDFGRCCNVCYPPSKFGWKSEE